MTNSGSRWFKWLVCAFLGVAVLAAFWPALHCTFVSFDDPDYITLNTNIQRGLDWQSIKWAFTTGHSANWHPLTWLTHELDCQFYGLNPLGHHLTNLLLHLANSVLLFLLFHRMTGALWRSAWVAAIFALHPLRVESVVWVSERKDVLSTFFWMLTVGAYLRYTEKFKVCNPESFRGKSSKFKVYYGLSLLFFALGLMAKSMLVTLPCVLLLLDYWPLGRLEIGPRFSWRLVVEKLPFFLLAAGASAVTFLVQDLAGVVKPLTNISLGERLANVCVAYVRYLGKIFWPSKLSVFYGLKHWSTGLVSSAVLLLAAITVWVVGRRRAQPYLAVGWFWFLGMLVPTVGLVQVGNQSMADRYTYLPSVGISLMVVWGLGELAVCRPLFQKGLAAAGVLTVGACLMLTPRQIFFWRNPVALFAHAADISDQDSLTCYNVGCAVMDQGDFPRAERCFERALKLAKEGDIIQLGITSTFIARLQNNLGCALLAQGNIAGAVSNFGKAVSLEANFPQAYYNLGRAFLTNNQPDVAVDAFQRALALDPNAADTHYKLANALVQLNRPADAIKEYTQALRLRPGMGEAANNLAWLLATCPNRSLRNGPRAVTLALKASLLSHDENPLILGTLAAAYAAAGQPADAVTTANRARELALAQKNPALAGVLAAQARQYETGHGGSHP